MGYTRHHAIVITSGFKEKAHAAWLKATDLGLQITNIVESKSNGYCSFLVIPDGSKEGWKESDIGDKKRGLLIDWMITTPECWCDWVLIEFGGDGEDAVVINDRQKEFNTNPRRNDD